METFMREADLKALELKQANGSGRHQLQADMPSGSSSKDKYMKVTREASNGSAPTTPEHLVQRSGHHRRVSNSKAREANG